MSTVQIEPLGPRDPDEVISFVVAAQDDPTRHVTLVGEGLVTVSADLAQVDGWRDRTLVATEPSGAVVGVLVADVDADLGRCYWIGPWADDEQIAAALLTAAEPLVADAPHRIFAPDTRNTAQGNLALGLGYEPGEASAILALDLSAWDDDPPTAGVRPLDVADHDMVAALHDQLFPDTHTPGRRLVRDKDTTVLVHGSPPRGYIATQPQPDATVYVDFVGVATDARGRGLGRTLVVAALRDASARGCRQAFLTVYVSNTAARRLYAGLGFVEERRAQPFTRDRRP